MATARANTNKKPSMPHAERIEPNLQEVVARVPEIFDQILGFVPEYDLLQAMAVCRAWKLHVDSSSHLKIKLFLTLEDGITTPAARRLQPEQARESHALPSLWRSKVSWNPLMGDYAKNVRCQVPEYNHEDVMRAVRYDWRKARQPPLSRWEQERKNRPVVTEYFVVLVTVQRAVWRADARRGMWLARCGNVGFDFFDLWNPHRPRPGLTQDEEKFHAWVRDKISFGHLIMYPYGTRTAEQVVAYVSRFDDNTEFEKAPLPPPGDEYGHLRENLASLSPARKD